MFFFFYSFKHLYNSFNPRILTLRRFDKHGEFYTDFFSTLFGHTNSPVYLSNMLLSIFFDKIH